MQDKNFREYNIIDETVEFLDTSIRTLFGKPITTIRKNPADKIINIIQNSETLSKSEQEKSAGLMRVNHCGEVCAQALYQGQALTARDPLIKAKFKQAALEENDHLVWCETRLNELNSHTSYLNPLWYLGSLSIGIIAGIAGDRWNLGFLAETENQVSEHLKSHLDKLPINDYKSRAIIEQMKIDEQEHATTAIEAGAHTLPIYIRYSMQLSSKIMTTIAFYI
jgi:ubiquinone biosynthesis monooxygenase Coq7